jgi:hypothetical protein
VAEDGDHCRVHVKKVMEVREGGGFLNRLSDYQLFGKGPVLTV